MEAFKIKVGDFITIKDEYTLKSEGETSSLIMR